MWLPKVTEWIEVTNSAEITARWKLPQLANNVIGAACAAGEPYLTTLEQSSATKTFVLKRQVGSLTAVDITDKNASAEYGLVIGGAGNLLFGYSRNTVTPISVPLMQ